MNLKPETFTDSKGQLHTAKSVHLKSFKSCFSQVDLYTSTFGSIDSTEIEQRFFGEIDRRGITGLDYFSNFNCRNIDHEAFQNMLRYMSTQKLRTPKGLEWLSKSLGPCNKIYLLGQMQRLRDMYSAIWTECVWLIADASQSNTKFIISDHPITVYNRRCGPRSSWCKDFNDPDIRFHATHTIFPLTIDKVLILTNLSWARNPYQSETALRPNPRFFRNALFKYQDIQSLRNLTEQEVLEINFIIKARALRYVAAAKEEWLYPEKKVSKENWNRFGQGYLLMPDPRSVSLGGEVFWGDGKGGGGSVDAYGRKPWEDDYGKEGLNEGSTLNRFKGEFARLFGPNRRGRDSEMGRPGPERDSEEAHKYYLGLDKKKKK